MHFHKYPYAANFEFASTISPKGVFKTRKGSYRIDTASDTSDIYHFRVTGKNWTASESQAGLNFRKSKRNLESRETRLAFTPGGGLRLQTRGGKLLLDTPVAGFFGQCGPASIFRFIRRKGDQFYGLGEKWTGFEHSGRNTKFWNTDICADFNPESFVNGKPAADPAYLSIPYLILKRGNVYIGLLLDNPFATFVSTASHTSIANQMRLKEAGDTFHLGAEEGQPGLYLLYGPSLPELTRKLQKLVGFTPLPPAWALGYQQCRWGYRSEKDLLGLDANFRKHEIPVDGLWLDIDYMDRYKVFTFNHDHFPNPARAMAKLAKAGRQVVPIIDPGVKLERGYGVYERGKKAAGFCKTPQGGEFVGLVWPGETVFPDFSIQSARDWWAGEVSGFAKLGINGAWLDMNDPSTGNVESGDMLFDHGRKSHSTYHNQYALGMAMASRQGFLDAHPGRRPFLLSRSGFTGSNRFAAIWTGDNYSNRHHLKNTIATTLNLALSGVPFNGPDVGGFGGHATPELISDWFQAGFLFPFFRNHSSWDTCRQEPWAFGKKTLSTIRHFIRLRYRFRHYLYQLFVEQERSGDAILRPLFYDFEDKASLPLGLVDDQFMVGPRVMHAPFLAEKATSRDVILPGSCKWYDVFGDRWIDGGKKISATPSAVGTPLYIRDGTILPLARIEPQEHFFRAEKADFHIHISGNAEASTRYVFDDGSTFAYRDGKRSVGIITARRSGDALSIEVVMESTGFGRGNFTFTVSREIRHVIINSAAARKCRAQGIPVGNGETTTWEVAGNK